MKKSNTSQPVVQTVPTDEGSLKAMWAQAAQEFEDICGASLTKSEIPSFDDVLNKIATQASDAGPKDKWAKPKKLGLEVLKGTKTLVDAASLASSAIPLPAAATNVIFAALDHALVIPQSIKGGIDTINGVFSHISAALSELRIYDSMPNIDPSLAAGIQLILMSFVKLCAYVVKYRQGGWKARLRQTCKSIFGDSDLTDDLAAFDQLVKQQHDIEGVRRGRDTLLTYMGVWRCLLRGVITDWQAIIALTRLTTSGRV
ncbi:hypothetical protein FB45DRAFT_156829 [Roridomyces roridus]|uniref:Fungal STAND N-terminal Goodbye domain-containing protein n=1 Tax=Roridomyces roridus TaxID=1738132 RepID=A0AAD7BEZ1_9AGAR|nr:hypothetical protein FB45DRAFT_156829 [Roridomyces roridus]